MNQLITSFFTGTGIIIENLDIKHEWEDLYITIQTPDSHLIIGMHGKNLDAFQHLLWRMAEKKLWEFVHVHLEVNDYMKAKDERLFRFLDSKIAFVTETGKNTRIPNLTSFERKKAHGYISEKAIVGLTTKSEGEWSERALVLAFSGTPLRPVPTVPVARKESSISTLSEDGVGI